MKSYFKFISSLVRAALVGPIYYHLWCLFLFLLTGGGIWAYIIQLDKGLIVTHMTDQVSWGAYIANFSFLVGVAASAVLLVVPTYVFHKSDIKRVVLIGQILAASAIIMALLFVVVDLGRPDRFLHIMPLVSKYLNFPKSMLAWDFVILNGYLVLNLHIPGYVLYKKYLGQEPKKIYYFPFVVLSIFWALSIHTIAAFLYSGFGGRPYWNSAILAPRFIVSAFVSAPAILLVIFEIIRTITTFKIYDSIFTYLKNILKVALPLNMFLLFCELFKEFYTDSFHSVTIRYLFFGHHEYHMLTPYIWSAITFEVLSILILFLFEFKKPLLLLACLLTFVGVWIEKGMGVIVPGFIPTPLGDWVEYSPSFYEFWVCLGIWSFGTLCFTVMTKAVLPLIQKSEEAQS